MGKRARTALIVTWWSLVGLGAICLVLRLFVYDLTTVQGDDMSPTLGPESLLLVNRLATPKLGDLVMLKTDKGHWEVRRVVAVPGDRIAMSNMIPVVNGVAATEAEVRTTKVGKDPMRVLRETTGGHSYLVLDRINRSLHDLPESKVEGGYYVLADNREADVPDSRKYGPVPRDKIRGVVSWVVKRGRVP